MTLKFYFVLFKNKPNMVNAPEGLNLAIFWGGWEDLICQKCIFAFIGKKLFLVKSSYLPKMLPVVILWVSAVLSTSSSAEFHHVFSNFIMDSELSGNILKHSE